MRHAGSPHAAPGRGSLVTVSGIDGGGKSTLIGGLAGLLERGGRLVEVVTPLKRDPAMLRALASLPAPPGTDGHWPARREALVAHHIGTVLLANAVDLVEPRLAAGVDVLCDRWVWDHLVSQEWFGVDLTGDLDLFRALPRPDLAVLLDLPAEVAQQRIDRRGDAGVGTGEPFLRFSRQRFLDHADQDGLVVVDGTAPVDALLREVQRLAGPVLITGAPR
ncbi:hypothetical protein OG455_28155 [Kitasatospora sp. NBC_01287]|uniref:dTMP kinase n=1 Tax=Kitasatospora sp. NBC_01287 TaxID=2903573 RepID=UPI002255D6B4|nr:hypothetical protein [Kitasatospora sp. NBC_01287]MCX4749335.1 hypothetical protein [Kitasatospora sp. NBC_01287]